jgi:serine/threonine protein phosphatase 1
MRTLVIGDIHGCLRALTTLLDVVAPAPADRIITLGDYVDRGPDSRGVLDCLIDLYDAGRLVALRGNHDVMMLSARYVADPLWLDFGGITTLLSYGATDSQVEEAIDGDQGFAGLLAGVPQRHWRFLEDDCVPWYETETHFFVHANADPDLPLDQQSDDMLYWQRLLRHCQHVSGKIMVCGHTRQKSGVPLNLGTTVCLDTNVYEDGWLTCLDVHTGRTWQANERGKARTGWLEECAETDD